MKIGVLASGSGSNLQAIINAIESGEISDSTIAVLICNRKEAYALERAKKHGIPAIYLSGKEFATREGYDKKVVEILKEYGVELVVLAGYLRWITPYFVESFKDKILNIHPSLLPSFKGLHGIEQAFEYGVKVTGVTVHFVDETEDGGAVIIQEAVMIENSDTLETLEEKIHKVEHKLYPYVIEAIRSGRVSKNGRIVKIN